VSKKKVKDLTLDMKYTFYEKSVQNTEAEVDNLNKFYEEAYGKKPYTLREDFCGTGMLMCDWVKQGKKYEAIGLDLDPEPISIGKERHLSKLTKQEQSRVDYIQANVMEPNARKSDIIVAFNFSYFIFKKRAQLIEYFSAVRKSLNKEGLFLLDLFGGPECQMPLEEETEYSKFSYFWDCKKFNPITNECSYSIHFKPNHGKKFRDVFTYDWRMWSVPELREILEEAGFSESHCYWEGDEDDGTGNGEFHRSEQEDNCESYVVYLAALP
jgi:cyclopropane fatty-acyl-phospholipid synthase-like methyltransferase